MNSDIRCQSSAPSQSAARVQWPQVTFESLMRWLRPAAGSPLLLGYCEDGLPLVLDLKDGHQGPILVIGDEEHPTGDLLKTLLLSAARLARDEVIGALVITANPQEYAYLMPSGLQAAFVPIEPAWLESVIDAISVYCRVVGWHEMPKLLLVVDDMQSVQGALFSAVAEQLFKAALAARPSGIVSVLCSPWRLGHEDYANRLQATLSPSLILAGNPDGHPFEEDAAAAGHEDCEGGYTALAAGYRKEFRVPVDLRSRPRDRGAMTADPGLGSSAMERGRERSQAPALPNLLNQAKGELGDGR